MRSVVRIYPGPPHSAAGTHIWGCSSVGRAPALQAGGQRFDPAQLHQTLIHCFQIASRLHGRELFAFPFGDYREPIWKQAASKQQVSLPPQGGPLAKRRAGLMFDNEIDWVIAHRARVPRTGCREAAGRTFVAMTRIQGRAHCRVVTSNCRSECKCSM